MNLKLRQLEVFAALMEAGSVSAAASLLSLTQPAISIALSNLEKEVGFRLFDRSRGFFAPTAEALLLAAETEQGMLALARIERCALDIATGRLGTISIASNGAIAFNLLPALIADFHREHPAVRIDLKIRSSRQIANWVSGRQVDIGLIDAPVPVAGLNVEIFKLPCVCIMRSDDELASHTTITPSLLRDRSVIGVTGDHDVDRKLDRLAAESNVKIGRNLTASYFAIMRNMVRQGAGIALVDAVNGKMELTDDVCWREFEPLIKYELALITALDHVRPKPVELFIEQLKLRLDLRA